VGRRALVFLLLLFGCQKVGPNFRPPPAPCKQGWIEEANPQLSVGRERLCGWWRLFQDPVLERLVSAASSQNLDLKSACYRIAEARANLGFAIGELFPQQQEAFGTAEKVRQSRNRANAPALLDFSDYQLGFQAAWELDIWGRYRRAVEAEQAGLLASYADYDDVLVLLTSDVAAVYVQIRTLEERLKIVKNNSKIQVRSLEISEAQFEAGFVTELDMQQSLSLLSETEARVPDLEREKRQAENALCVLLGIVPQELERLLCCGSGIPAAPGPLVVNLPEQLLCRRPDIRRAFYEAAAQSARVGVAYSDFFPRISLNGEIALAAEGNLLSRDSLTYGYGAGFVWPLFNYGRIGSRVKAEEARFCRLVTEYQNRVLRAYSEVEDGLVAFIKAQEEAALLEGSVKAAGRSVELSKTQYVEGITDYTTVLNTQEALLSSEERLALARGGAALGLIATYKALGGGW